MSAGILCTHGLNPCDCYNDSAKKKKSQDKKELFLNAFKNFFPSFAALTNPENEYVFHPIRRWRFDYAWPEKKVAVEIEGAVFIPGKGHSSGSGISKDIEKYNAATLLGWRVMRYTTTMLRKNAWGCCQEVFALLCERPQRMN